MFSVENEQPDGSWVTDCEKPTLNTAANQAMLNSKEGHRSRVSAQGEILQIYNGGYCVFELKQEVDEDDCGGHH